MASIQTYILICDGCTAPFIPLDAERVTAPRRVTDVRDAAKALGWSSSTIPPEYPRQIARTEDRCASCTRDAQATP